MSSDQLTVASASNPLPQTGADLVTLLLLAALALTCGAALRMTGRARA